MRILHTSDWHLGRTLHQVDLIEHQAAFLDHLVEVVREEQVGAVVVAGDVYDRAIPPVEAVRLLGDALARLSELTQVVLTPGNHDSATRLGFGAELMRDTLHVRARVADVGRPVELHGEDGALLVYALPYLDPDDARHHLAEDPAEPLARSHEAVLSAAMRRISADLAQRRAGGGPRVPAVVAAHAFVTGGEVSESERDIRVGGVDSVPSGVFRGVDYVALGHLHGAQSVPIATLDGAEGSGVGRTVARYSGSPLAYSFSEMNHTKSTVLLDVGPDGVRGEPQLIPAPVPRRMGDVTGTLEEILGAAGEKHVDRWVRVTVTDPVRPADLHARVRARLPHALSITYAPPAREGSERAGVVTAAADPLEVCASFVDHVRGSAPSAAEQRVLRDVLEHVNAAERSA
ncbi:nuclease SbcCD subunit D [Flavimobilis marinus]|uniref:Nuclease SbcCD subunit D n=1 Tax=Flavimobilis marinus TaxID=285351 RepID=A0A1I2CAA9_9MICO|nr:exonuclease SbcCD subunit D [Flavimobilis marinus]GHG48075.1 nuclease SbcCD subunit D [Flavimobilis marinus]SFE65279.1 Exodeoxyribonuclease I subunit D [Flavimobilis marinus]